MMRTPSVLLMSLALIAAVIALIFLAASPGAGARDDAFKPPAQSQAQPPRAPSQAKPTPTTSPSTQPQAPRIEELTIAGELYRLEVAADERARARGLMERDAIEDHHGMIFIFPEPALLSFWMKNCLIDIDVMFVDAHGVITATHTMRAEPLRRPRESEFAYEQRLRKYTSRRPAQFAIELKAGEIDRLQLRPGQTIQMDLERLKKLAAE